MLVKKNVKRYSEVAVHSTIDAELESGIGFQISNYVPECKRKKDEHAEYTRTTYYVTY